MNQTVRISSYSTIAISIALCIAVMGGVLAGTRVLAKDDQPAAKKPSVSARIADLSWIQGHWATTFEENELDEIWSPPLGDCMMASFRWVKSGKIWMYELLTLAEDGDTVVLRFKHFSRELHGWEEKDEALTLSLVKLEKNRAVFQSDPGKSPGQIIFHKQSQSKLTVSVGGEKEDGSDGLVIKYNKKG